MYGHQTIYAILTTLDIAYRKKSRWNKFMLLKHTVTLHAY